MPDSKSRDQLGKQTSMSLLEYFQIVHGKEETVKFQQVNRLLSLSLSLSLLSSLVPLPLPFSFYVGSRLMFCIFPSTRLALTSSRAWLPTLL